jgi:hypothetical protein
MLAADALALFGERLPDALPQDAEIVLVLDELENIDDHITRAGVG